MSDARTTRLHSVLGLLSALCVSAVGGCQSEPQGAGIAVPLHSGTHCPDGYIAWDFNKQPVRYDSEFYQVAKPDGSVPQVDVSVIVVKDVDCSGLRARGWNASSIEYQEEYIERFCKNSLSCPVRDGCLMTYTCGELGEEQVGGDGEKAIVHDGDTSYWGTKLQCDPEHLSALSPASDAGVAYERPDGAVCVPRYCHGKARRNLDLECVPDDDLQELPLRDISSSENFGRFTIDISPTHEVLASASSIDTLHLGTAYKYDLDLNLGDHDASNFSEARLMLWLSEVYRHVTTGEEIETFACVLASPMPTDDHGEDGNLLRYRVEVSTPRECVATGEASIEQRRAFLGESWSDYRKVGGRINHTLDVEGRYAIFDGNDPGGDRTAIDACAPNPLDFFQIITNYGWHDEDGAQQVPDMVGYLRQRQIDGHLDGSRSGSFGGFGRSMNATYASPTMRVGMLEADIGQAKVTVIPDGREVDTIPVDFTWFQSTSEAIETRINAQCGELQACLMGRVVQGGDGQWYPSWDGDRAECNRKYGGPCGLKTLRAGIYLWPTDKAGERGEYIRVGSVGLDRASRTGSSVNATATLDAGIKRQFFDSSSPLHIARDQRMRSFEVVTCLEMDGNGLEGRYFKSRQQLTSRPWGNHPPNAALGKGIAGENDAAYTPSGALNPGPACRYAKTPLLVEALYLSYPVNPSADSPRPQRTAAVQTGSGKLGATQNSDTDLACGDSGRTGSTCRNSSLASMNTGGGVSKSFYASRNRQEQVAPARGQAPADGNSVSLDGTVEVFGMQVLDLVGSEASQRVAWPQPAVSVEMRLEIPLGDAAEALRRQTTGHTVEWKQGRYAGQDGLGVAIGQKIPFQIGPIPGELKVAFSIGVSASILGTFTYFDSDVAEGSALTFDGAYPCLDGEDCSRIELDEDSQQVSEPFAAAVDYCKQRGGRLAQLDTAEGAMAYLAALGDSGKYWTGGQQAWVYRDPQCDVVFSSSCLNDAVSSYRWLSDNTQFARADGTANAVWDSSPSYFFGASYGTFGSTLPKVSALIIDASNDTASLAAVDIAHGVVCEYPAADYDRFIATSFGLELGVAAGFGVSLCVPGDKIGICLGGALNVASITFTPQFQYEFHDIYLGDEYIHRAGQMGFVGPWSLTLLEGELYAEFHLFLFSVKHTIVAFRGFKVADGKFFDNRTPFLYPGEMQ